MAELPQDYTAVTLARPKGLNVLELARLSASPPYPTLLIHAPEGAEKTALLVHDMLLRVDPSLKAPQVLCFCPSLERVLEIEKEVTGLCTRRGIKTRVATIMAPGPLPRVTKVVEQVLVGTSGTLKSWITKRILDTTNIKIIAIDNVDQHIEDDFKRISRFIKREGTGSGGKYQVLLFTATFSEKAKSFAQFMNPSEANCASVVLRSYEGSTMEVFLSLIFDKMSEKMDLQTKVDAMPSTTGLISIQTFAPDRFDIWITRYINKTSCKDAKPSLIECQNDYLALKNECDTLREKLHDHNERAVASFVASKEREYRHLKVRVEGISVTAGLIPVSSYSPDDRTLAILAFLMENTNYEDTQPSLVKIKMNATHYLALKDECDTLRAELQEHNEKVVARFVASRESEYKHLKNLVEDISVAAGPISVPRQYSSETNFACAFDFLAESNWENALLNDSRNLYVTLKVECDTLRVKLHDHNARAARTRLKIRLVEFAERDHKL